MLSTLYDFRAYIIQTIQGGNVFFTQLHFSTNVVTQNLYRNVLPSVDNFFQFSCLGIENKANYKNGIEY